MKHLGVLLSVLLSVLLLAACGGSSSSPPGNGGPPAGTPGWALTESLVGPLSSSLSVALGDGRVLLVGGTQASTALRLYDPLTGTWSDGPAMQYTRTDASSAIRLPDGRVAILGGSVGDARTSVEVYDPTTGNVTLQPGTSSVPRAWHAATLLADGRVLVVGGTDGTFPIAGSTAVEIWDPATGLFTATDPTAEARAFSGIARLDDDTVLVIGGDDGGIAKASCERYDPATGTWTSADDLNLARTGLKTTVAVCGDGRVLATGGATSGAELYDPLLDAWTLRTDLVQGARTAGLAVPLGDGRVLLAGGILPGPGIVGTGDAEIFDPLMDAFEAIAGLNLGRSQFSGALLGTGQVLVVGGLESSADGTTATCEIWTEP